MRGLGSAQDGKAHRQRKALGVVQLAGRFKPIRTASDAPSPPRGVAWTVEGLGVLPTAPRCSAGRVLHSPRPAVLRAARGSDLDTDRRCLARNPFAAIPARSPREGSGLPPARPSLSLSLEACSRLGRIGVTARSIEASREEPLRTQLHGGSERLQPGRRQWASAQ